MVGICSDEACMRVSVTAACEGDVGGRGGIIIGGGVVVVVCMCSRDKNCILLCKY